MTRMHIGWKWTAVLLVLVALTGGIPVSHAQGQPVDDPGSVGTTLGTVLEATDEWILVQRPGGLPLRHWFKWIDSSNSTPDQAIQSLAVKLKAGDKIEVRRSFDDRERIESLVLVSALPTEAPKPEPPKEETPAPSPVESTNAAPVATTPTSAITAAPTTSLAESVNGFFDKLVAVGGRILELPLFVFLAGVGIAGLVLALVIGRYSKREGRARIGRALLVAECGLGFIAVVFVIDRKLARLQTAVIELRSKTSADAAALLSTVSKLEAKRRSFLRDPAEVQKLLAEQFGDVSVQPSIYDEAIDFVQVHVKRPLAKVYVAVVDLRNPAVEIELGATLDKKRLTTVFARESDCTVAINGEAGSSPAPNSGLGDWRGNLVRLGQVLLREDFKFPAPFLCFDRQNRADFIAGSSTNRTLAPDRYNVIWGRWDAIINGVVQTADAGNRQPRTAMAINKDGTLLYLLVADGRQPSYSTGLSRDGVGKCLKAFGAYNGMMCDEGGSSCIYLKQFGGIVNIPADNYGQERPTYTHFGIRLRGGK